MSARALATHWLRRQAGRIASRRLRGPMDKAHAYGRRAAVAARHHHNNTTPARVAQSAERKTLNLVVVGSSPTSGAPAEHGAAFDTRCCKMSRVQIPASPDLLWGCSSGAECLLRSVRRPWRHAIFSCRSQGPRGLRGRAPPRGRRWQAFALREPSSAQAIV